MTRQSSLLGSARKLNFSNQNDLVVLGYVPCLFSFFSVAECKRPGEELDERVAKSPIVPGVNTALRMCGLDSVIWGSLITVGWERALCPRSIWKMQPQSGHRMWYKTNHLNCRTSSETGDCAKGRMAWHFQFSVEQLHQGGTSCHGKQKWVSI